jgi:hypothetical protein
VTQGKQPPPDSLGNLNGRALELRTMARQRATTDARGGDDFTKALTRRLAEIRRELDELRRRTEKLGVSPPPPSPTPVTDEFLLGMESLRDL